MKERIENEIQLLKEYYQKVEYIENGQWVHIESYPIPSGLKCNRTSTDVCFQIPPQYPGTPPYGFYVPAGILFDGNKPKDYNEPVPNNPPFSGNWGLFSWTIETGWHPTVDLLKGSNLLNFVRTFKDRFIEGV